MLKSRNFSAVHDLGCIRSAGVSTIVILVLATLLHGTGIASAFSPQSSALLTVGSATGLAGNSVDLAVTLVPGSASVCTLQFDLQLPASLSYVSTATGSAAAAAAKSASGNLVGSTARILVFGMNVNNIGAGPVAVVTVTIAPGTSPGTAPVVIANITASDSGGNGVAIAGGDGSVIVSPPPDTTPPVISNVVSSGVTYFGAMITWTTNEAADTQVEYGLTTSYGNSTTLNGSMVTSHSQALTGLSASTTYHYRVKSKDAAGNLATSGNNTFTTPAAPDTTPPVISNVASSGVTYSGATITWTTNEAADTQVEHGLTMSYGNSTTLNGSMVTSHSQVLTGLSASTTYHYRVKSKDAAGNLAVSGDFTFTTSTQSPTGLTTSGMTASNISSSGATITWSTNVPADSLVNYGTKMSCSLSTKIDKTLVTSHSMVLSKLRSNTTYYFKVRSRDASGNTSVSAVLSFKTAPSTSKVLAYPRLATKTSGAGMNSGSLSLDDSDFTGVAIANLSGTEAVLTFTAYDLTGAEITGDNVTNPTLWTLAPGAQLAVMDIELFGFGLPDQNAIGWIDIASSNSAIAGFTLMFNASLTSMDGATISADPMTEFIFPEIQDQGFTDFYVSNPNDSSAHLMFQLIDANGTLRSSAFRAIPPLGAVAESIVNIFRDFTPESSDYVRVSSDVGAFPFQFTGKMGQDVAGLNGIDTGSGATTLYSPQYVVGGSYTSTLSITNLDNTGGSLMLRLINDDGAQIGCTRVAPIAGHGKAYVSDPSFFCLPPGEMVQGYVVIKSSGPSLAGNVVFRSADGSGFMAALPLQSQLEASLVFSHVASNQTYFTGLALLNPHQTDVSATIELYQEDGTLDGRKVVVIPALHRIADLADELFPNLIGQDRTSGYIRVNVDQPVAAYSVFGRRDLRTLSAIPAQVIR